MEKSLDFEVGQIVRHRLHPGLRGRIIEMEGRWAFLELLTYPSHFFHMWFANRPMPVLLENLERVE
jgi:heat shock protein HspQ